MGEDHRKDGPVKATSKARKARLARALRENLKRRKAQARRRKDGKKERD